LGLVSGEPDAPGAPGDQRVLIARLRAVAKTKDAELAALRAQVAVLRADLEAGRALTSRRAEAITAILSFFAGFLITDGHIAYQPLLPPAGRHPAMLPARHPQSWAAGVITVLRDAHHAVEEARSRGQPVLRPALLAELRDRHDEAVRLRTTLNRLRDWDGDGNHPGYTLGCWLRGHADQVWLFTTESAVEWTSNSAEQAVKGPKRHRAVSGYWHTQQTLGRWCRIHSYLGFPMSHGLTAIEAISTALAGKSWLPPTTPATAPRNQTDP
jgi:hypothetical protein